MKRNGTARRRALTLAIAAGVAGVGCLGVVLADSAGAATPTASPDPAKPAHIVSMSAPPGSTPPTTPSATRSAASAPTTAAAGKTSVTAVPSIEQAQLSATQLPAPSAEKWVATGAPSTRSITGHDIGENECAKVDGATAWTQQAFAGGDGQNVAIQDTFVFTSASAARSAYQNVVTGMNTCQQTTRALQEKNKVPGDAIVTETASRPDADAWKRGWTGVMGMSAAGPQTNHFYLAVNGTRLIVLQFTEFPGQAAPYNVAADPQVLAMLDTDLAS